jgi:hypothetical protein
MLVGLSHVEQCVVVEPSGDFMRVDFANLGLGSVQ